MNDIMKFRGKIVEDMYIGIQILSFAALFLVYNFILKTDTLIHNRLYYFMVAYGIYVFIKVWKYSYKEYIIDEDNPLRPNIYISFFDGIVLMFFLYITKDYFQFLSNLIYIYLILQVLRFAENNSMKFSNFISICYIFLVIMEEPKKIISIEVVSNIIFFYLITLILSSVIKDINYLEEQSEYMMKEIKHKNKKLNEMATKDYLTNMYNHKSFYDKLTNVTDDTKEKNKFCLALVDIDNFKNINDEHGHLIGDKILKEVSSIIRNNIRHTDIAARYGGEEFAIIFIDTSIDDGIHICERMRNEIEKHNFKQNNKNIKVTISAGIKPSSYDITSSNQNEFIEKVDSLLYRAKSLGKNRIVY